MMKICKKNRFSHNIERKKNGIIRLANILTDRQERSEKFLSNLQVSEQVLSYYISGFIYLFIFHQVYIWLIEF